MTHARASSSTRDTATDEQTAEVMANLWERYKETMRARLSAIEAASNQLAQGKLDESERSVAYGEAHKLAGSIGTFGYLEASRLAREIEQLLDPQRSLGQPEAEQLASLTQSLRTEVEEAAAHSPRDIP